MVQVSDDGFVELLFNMNIYVDEEMDQFTMRTEQLIPDVKIRNLQGQKKVIDLSKFMSFTLVLGDKETEIDSTKYAFSVEI